MVFTHAILYHLLIKRTTLADCQTSASALNFILGVDLFSLSKVTVGNLALA